MTKKLGAVGHGLVDTITAKCGTLLQKEFGVTLLSVSLVVSVCVCLSACLSVSSACLFICLYVCFLCLFVCLSVGCVQVEDLLT